jgi:pyridoxamine 5'-phosphate oxidase
MTVDPIARFLRWFNQARKANLPLPEAMALATVSADKRPAVRFVLLKGADKCGFVFFTDARSRKGRELRANPYASAVFYWDALGRQVRIDGRVEEVDTAEADAYWESRPRASRLAARSSVQSAPLAGRSVLIARWKRMAREYTRREIPRPRNWTGFRIVPDAIEFWTRHEPRLHHRELFRRTPRGWKRTLLQP